MSFCRSSTNKSSYFADNNDEIPRFGPFNNEERRQYNRVQRYIIENRGTVLNSQQRRNIPIYLKGQTQYEEDPRSRTIYQTARLIRGKASPENESLFQRAKNFVSSVVQSITRLGDEDNREKSNSLAIRKQNFNDIEVETFDKQLDAVPIPQLFNQNALDQDQSMRDQHQQRRISIYRPQGFINQSQQPSQQAYLAKRKSRNQQYQEEEEQIEDINDNLAQTRQNPSKRLKLKHQQTDEEKILRQLLEQQNIKFQQLQETLVNLQQEQQNKSKKLEDKIESLKKSLVSNFSGQVKDKIVKVWKDGTDKFYQEAKSVMSNNSNMGDGYSVISGLSRSRSNSRDYLMNKSFMQTNNNANNNYTTYKRDISRSHSEFGGDLDEQLLDKNFNNTPQGTKTQLQKKFDEIQDSSKKSNLIQQKSVFFDNDRNGAISPIEQIKNAQPSDIFANTNLNVSSSKGKNESSQIMNQSPAFGLSSNLSTEKKQEEKQPILIDKPPSLDTDPSLKKPVAQKPSLFGNNNENEQNNKTESTFKAGSLFESKPSTSLFEDKKPASASIFSQSNLSTGSLFGQIKPVESTFKVPEAKQIETENKQEAPSLFKSMNEKKDNITIPPSIFSAKETETNKTSLFSNPIGEKPSLFAFSGNQNLTSTSKDKQEEKTEVKQSLNLFGATNKDSGNITATPSLFGNTGISQDKKEDMPTSLFTQAEKKTENEAKKDETKSITSNPLLSSMKANNPFLQPKQAANIFASIANDATSQQAPSLFGSNQSEVNNKSSVFGLVSIPKVGDEVTTNSFFSFGNNTQKPTDKPTNPFLTNQAQTTEKQNPFVQQVAPQTEKSNPFAKQGQQSNPFASAQPNPFTANNQQQNQPQSIFNQQIQTPSLFGQPLESQKTQLQSNPFAQVNQQPQNSLFAATQQNLFAQPQQASLFGGGIQQNSNPFVQNAGSLFQGQQAQSVQKPHFNTVSSSFFKQFQQSNLFGSPEKKKEDQDDGLFSMGSAGKNASGKKKK
ncbi:UNKNOWN [Stylonychia lemnae]|uniref:Uncharacterized protein n=1 Tax=Stylonychia lemnae TaxID=5949 RepID=A0A078ALW0_STYLE|nr:UNKNOWN [Stylonychia lemnae]|eukprot:CDW81843.1 UNKNOWN [Stylonychia lemnae]